MTPPATSRPQFLAIGVFSATYFAVAGIVGPTIVVVFNLGIVEPAGDGWPCAIALFVVALFATFTFTATFAAGIFGPCSWAKFRQTRLLLLAFLSALVALTAPLIAFAGLMLIGPAYQRFESASNRAADFLLALHCRIRVARRLRDGLS